MRNFRPGCLIELLIGAVILWMVVLALPYAISHQRAAGPGTLDPILNHQGVYR